MHVSYFSTPEHAKKDTESRGDPGPRGNSAAVYTGGKISAPTRDEPLPTKYSARECIVGRVSLLI